MSKEISFEVLAVGTWNGLSFKRERLDQIVANFKKLSDVHKPFLKLGHNDKQDGMPALGWVEDVWINATNKLMVKAKDVPEVLYKAIQKKLYKRVSVELDLEVEYKKENIGDVLTAVAILGADVPAVNTLADLQAYMSIEGNITGANKVVLTAIETDYKPNPKKEELDMDELEKLNKKFDALMGRVEGVEEENKTLKAANDKLTSENATFTASAKKREEDDKKAAVKLSRDKATGILEAGVKSKTITPAQREHFTALLQIDDDEAVQKVDFDLLEKMVGKGSASFSTSEKAISGNTGDNDELSPDEQVTAEVQKLINAGTAKDFTIAQQMVFNANPKLAREYMDFNDQEAS